MFWECAKKSSQKLTRECKCGKTNCGKGKFCYELNGKLGCYGFGECVDDGENKLKAKCQCGDEICKPGKYWHEGECDNIGATPGKNYVCTFLPEEVPVGTIPD